MKSFKQLITESIEELINEATIGDIWQSHDNTRLSSFEKQLSTHSSFDNFDKILARLTDAQLGGLIGECINIFRDQPTINFISVVIPREQNANYTITNINEEKISKIEIRGKDNIIITRNYIEKNFPRQKVSEVIKNIINDYSSYEFASYADPSPHPITEEMLGKHKIYNHEKTQSFDRETRLHKTTITKTDSGKTKDVNTLKLFTINTGAGINQGSKRSTVVDVGRQGRKSLPIKNFYNVNNGADYCVRIKNYPVYAISIDRSNKTTLDNQISNKAYGIINNVYIKGKVKDDMYTSPEFLVHLTNQLNLRSENYIRSSEVRLDSPNVKEKSDNSDAIYKLLSQVNHLISGSEKISPEALDKCKKLYNMILQKYGTRVPSDIYRKLPAIIKTAIMRKQEKRRAENKNRIDVKAAFGRRY